MNCCRTCMSTTSLNPIFQHIDKSKKYTDILAIATGLKILLNDSLPQVICTDCVNFINIYQDFRDTCRNSHRTLINCIKYVNMGDNNITIKSEIDTYPTATVTVVKIEEINDFDMNNDNIDQSTTDQSTIDQSNDHSNCGERIENVKCKENIEFNMSVEDLLKMKIDITLNKPKSHKDVELRSEEVVRSDVTEISKEVSADTEERTDIDTEDESDVEPTSEAVENKGVDSVAVKERNVELNCKYCHKVYKSILALKVHYKIHTGRNTVCEHCGKKFVSKRKLLIHCKSKHDYEKTDKCSFCDYKGCTPCAVKIHERTHTGEKPYVCQKCGASFHRQSSYRQHVPTHLPEKTVKCDQCPALFKSITLMRIHKYRHRAPQYTYTCRVCDTSFARRRNVVRHYQRIHGVQAKEQDIDRVKICRN